MDSFILTTDKTLHELEQKKHSFYIYKSYVWIIIDYKASDNPEEFKREYYKEFKEWDKATNDMRIFLKKYEIQSKKDLEDYQSIYYR